MANVDIFRFDGYEDVFIEGNGYLHAVAEPYGWPYLMCVNLYTPIDGKPGEYMREDTSGADIEYLRQLEHAPVWIAREIVFMSTRNYLAHREDLDADEREGYLEYKAYEIDETTRAHVFDGCKTYREKQAALRDLAINWQCADDGEIGHSYGYYADWQGFFEAQGRKYGLLTEFRENGIC